MEKEYYVGLDLGTSSVGWAATDVNYRLLREKGKDLWGVRLFEEADTAAARRIQRVARRRRQREVARIGMLKEYFADEIDKADPSFYERLEESKYYPEDKKTDGKYAIFADKNYTDKDYFAEFPTIFHLRKEMMENPKFFETHDVRFLYLALLNMFKHRGHFLNAGLSDQDDSQGIAKAYRALADCADKYETLPFSADIGDNKIKELGNILSDRQISRTVMAERVRGFFEVDKKREKEAFEVIKGVCGLKFCPSTIFDVDDTSEKKENISFQDSDFDEKLEEMAGQWEDVDMEMLQAMKQLHDSGLLAKVMRGYEYLSQARVADYERHKEDLKSLKSFIRKNLPAEYNKLFREMEPGSYSAYVDSVNAGQKERRNVEKRSREDLYGYVKKILKEAPDSPEKQDILDKIENESLLPKQLTSENGVIPNQVHAREMRKILANAEKYFSFLREKDENDLTVSERIIQLFEFQIPYYVGPIPNVVNAKKEGSTEEKNVWAVRQKSGKVLPWNIDQMVDMKKAREDFVYRMVRHCSYLNGKHALPKNSLLYQRYCVLNELNNLRINGEKPPVKLKQDIYQALFISEKKVTIKKLCDYLAKEGLIESGDTNAISGIDTERENQAFSHTLSSYAKFSKVLGPEEMKKDETRKMAEQIIFWATVYSDDRKLMQELLQEHYGDRLSKEQIKKISGFKFHDWGRLSKEFLELDGCDKKTGLVLPLISMMWETNSNLMEILSENFTYMENVKEQAGSAEKILCEMRYEDLEGLYLSNPVKRMTWQTILILRELEKVTGSVPNRIFVEMPRGGGEKGKRTFSRQKKLLALYKNCQIDGRNWVGEIGKCTDGQLRGKKLYLYYLQQGRCMYSGEPIDLGNLFDDNLYDIDHIYPRHFVKDDSIENNLVLVKKQLNAKKSDDLIDAGIVRKNKPWWKELLEGGFITKEKYNRLTDRQPLKEDDERLAHFIERQIVETGQGTKTVAHLLEQLLPDTEVVYVKAGNVSDFRKDRNLLKSRTLNDFHHAKDAYLNIVVGNTYLVKFTKNPRNFIDKEYKKDQKKNGYNLSRMFDFKVERDGELAWDASSNGSIATVNKMMAKNTPMITRMSFERHGKIANVEATGKKKIKKKAVCLPVKGNDDRLQEVKKYGGFFKVKNAYFFLVEHEVKGKRIRTLKEVPIYLEEELSGERGKLREYCESWLKMTNPDVRLEKIKVQSLIKYNGYLLYLMGKKDDQYLEVGNAVPLCLDQHWAEYSKRLEKIGKTIMENKRKKEQDKEKICEDEKVTKEKNGEFYDVLCKKHTQTIFKNRPASVGKKLVDGREKFFALEFENQVKVLNNILKSTKLSADGSVDLSLIGEGSTPGFMKINREVSNADEFFLINQSPTGCFTSTIDLKTI